MTQKGLGYMQFEISKIRFNLQIHYSRITLTYPDDQLIITVRLLNLIDTFINSHKTNDWIIWFKNTRTHIYSDKSLERKCVSKYTGFLDDTVEN